MKKKILVIFFLSIIPVLLIYIKNKQENFVYLSIGDDLAKGHTPFDTYNLSYTDYVYNYLKTIKEDAKINKDFIKEDLRIKDLINDIKNPNSNNNTNITQALKDANIITISVGSEELFSKLRSNYLTNYINNKKNFNYVDLLIEDYDELLTEIRQITRKDIYIIGFYNPIEINENNETYLKSLFNYIDIKFSLLEKKHNIIYIRIDEEFFDKKYYLPNIQNAFPSLEGYNYIANEIIAKIKESY